jgi:two-component system OmpR family sensor kinase
VTLRARLVLTLVALAAVGLVTLAAVTYATQRSFQRQRIDDQARAAQPAVERQLDEAAGLAPGGAGRGAGGRDDGPGGPARGGPPGPAFANLPPGTYGERRTADGAVVGDPVTISYGQAALSPPRLPARLRAGERLTVRARSGDLRYRVRTGPGRGGGLTVVAVPLNGVEATLNRLLLVEGLVIGGVLLALGALSWLLVRLGLRPLERIGRTAGAIAGGDLSHRVEVARPGTEVGRLGTALNAMLGRLEDAFAERAASEARLRAFLSDASHELRTPLASIRGYAELFRIGAAREPADTEKAMRRIEEEAARMGVLVEDLLLLARLDEVREAATEAVDLAGLVQDAAADARALDPDRPVDARIDGEPVVLGDADQLRQVLANLVRNALVHTPPGTPVALSARTDGGAAEVEVRDRGPGLPAGDADAVFERFWRAEGGRERGRAGAGLGLAIVAGIVAAHGGEVRAHNAPGGGAAFVFRLPLAAGPSARAPGPPRPGDPSAQRT